jgi:sugar/nucleoside kinase (ribokinase family)
MIKMKWKEYKKMDNNKSKFHIASIGYLLTDWLFSLDHFPILPNEHQNLAEALIEPGGMCNFLIAGQRLGGRMAALDAIGADPYGLDLLAKLSMEGVDITQVVKIPGARSRSTVVMSDSLGQHVFLPYFGDAMPEQALASGWKQLLMECDALYLDGFTLKQPHVRKAALEASRSINEQGRKVFFDPGPTGEATVREVLPFTYGMMLTAAELSGLAGQGVDGLFTASGVLEIVVVKEGEKGCSIYERGSIPLHCPGFVVPVVDAMGAGDVFNAAFILSLLQGKSLPECGTFANAAGAVKVQKFGAGCNAPMLVEVKEVIRNHPVSK